MDISSIHHNDDDFCVVVAKAAKTPTIFIPAAVRFGDNKNETSTHRKRRRKGKRKKLSSTGNNNAVKHIQGDFRKLIALLIEQEAAANEF